MLCVWILYISGGTYSSKSTPNDRFYWETFHGSFIYSQSFCQKSAERKFCILVWCLAWSFTSKKPTQYLLRVLLLYMSGVNYSLKSTSNSDFWEAFSWHGFSQKFAKRLPAKKYFFVFHFAGDNYPGSWTMASHPISQHTIYQTATTTSIIGRFNKIQFG